MAGIITIAKGHDASYPWKQIGVAEPGKPGKPVKNAGKGVGYYLSPAEKGGEPPGIWTGKAGAELDLQPGATVERQGTGNSRRLSRRSCPVSRVRRRRSASTGRRRRGPWRW